MMHIKAKDSYGMGSKQGKVRLGILVSHPIQYFVPVYSMLAQNQRIDLTVIYRTRVGVDAYYDTGFSQIVSWDIPLLDGYRSHFLSAKTVLNGFEPGIVKEILHRRFDVLIVHGYNSLTNLLAIAVAKLIGTRVIIRGDTRLQKHHHAVFWKQLFKRMMFKTFDGFLTIGSMNREYYTAFGVPPEHIFFAPFCVNNATFSLSTEEHRIRRREYREILGLPEDSVVVLYASKLSKRKRPGDLIKSFAKITSLFPDAWLIVAGSGEEEHSLRAMVGEFSVVHVRFIGFQNQSALPSLYAASDCFVLPSDEEPWGLVLNEVMAAGLPVIVSDEVGAVPDLVDGKGTGLIYKCGDIEALAAALEHLLQSATLRREMGEKARHLIREWDVEACVSGIVSAVSRFR